MQCTIYNKIEEDESITSIKVEKVHEPKAAVLNELLGLFVIQRNITEAGLKELVLGNWLQVWEPLDDTVLQMLFSKCNSLTKLTVRYMYETSEGNRMKLARQVAAILAQIPTIERIDFESFSSDDDAGEGEVILQAIANAVCLPQLTHFDIGGNPSWFL